MAVPTAAAVRPMLRSVLKKCGVGALARWRRFIDLRFTIYDLRIRKFRLPVSTDDW